MHDRWATIFLVKWYATEMESLFMADSKDSTIGINDSRTSIAGRELL